jgi:hypothetical protein
MEHLISQRSSFPPHDAQQGATKYKQRPGWQRNIAGSGCRDWVDDAQLPGGV